MAQDLQLLKNSITRLNNKKEWKKFFDRDKLLKSMLMALANDKRKKMQLIVLLMVLLTFESYAENDIQSKLLVN